MRVKESAQNYFTEEKTRPQSARKAFDAELGVFEPCVETSKRLLLLLLRSDVVCVCVTLCTETEFCCCCFLLLFLRVGVGGGLILHANKKFRKSFGESLVLRICTCMSVVLVLLWHRFKGVLL